MDLTRRRLFATLIAAPFAALTARGAEEDVVLSKEEIERLKRFLPRTYGKLQRRDPVFVAVCGDEISAFYPPWCPQYLESGHGRGDGWFLDRLGVAFYYHGGVVDTSPFPPGRDAELEKQWENYRKLRGQWEKTHKGEAPEIPGGGAAGLCRFRTQCRGERNRKEQSAGGYSPRAQPQCFFCR